MGTVKNLDEVSSDCSQLHSVEILPQRGSQITKGPLVSNQGLTGLTEELSRTQFPSYCCVIFRV